MFTFKQVFMLNARFVSVAPMDPLSFFVYGHQHINMSMEHAYISTK
jgi:hypothetical protein